MVSAWTVFDYYAIFKSNNRHSIVVVHILIWIESLIFDFPRIEESIPVARMEDTEQRQDNT